MEGSRAAAVEARSEAFQIPQNYDFTKSSELNYCSEKAEFVGKYGDIRSQLDYTYHKHYSAERQLLHDKLIDRFLRTKVHDRDSNMECEVPLENWIVFTAGPMGAGKGHTMQWLAKEELFPSDAFVNVDPDLLRQLLPETARYNEIDNNSTGYFTQKEVNYISEVLSYHSLLRGKNVLVDGSLRNAHWYLEYFKNLREKFPIIKIAILHVTAKPDTVLKRARNRAKVTGRFVPEETILESMRTIPESLSVLCPHAEFSATFANEDNESEPRLLHCTMQERIRDLSSTQSDQCLARDACCLTLGGNSANNSSTQGCKNEAKMNFSWSLRWVDHESGLDKSKHEGDVRTESAEKKQGEGDASFRKRKAESEQTSYLTAGSKCVSASPYSLVTPVSPMHVAETASNSSFSSSVSYRNDSRIEYRIHELSEPRYILESPQGTAPLESWKFMFAAIWEMKCALPDVLQTPRETPAQQPAPREDLIQVGDSSAAAATVST